MSGYADRKRPSKGVVHPLWAKALAIEDSNETRAVIVTTDLIGLPRDITEPVSLRVQKEFGLGRAQIAFNSSHTHAGPVVWPNLKTMFDLGSDEGVVREYARNLREALFSVTASALGGFSAAQLSYGIGTANFSVNRRERTSEGVRIGVNPIGAVDPDVPVLAVRSIAGQLKAVIFGYACHNATLTEDCHQLNGDYAGYAQIELEQQHPGATALFLALCGGDQNPSPRGSLEIAESHGKTLAAEVNRVLHTTLSPLDCSLRTAFKNIELNFAPHTRRTFADELKHANSARVRRAEALLDAYEQGHPVTKISYPVQALRFGSNLTLLMLGGEVVADYSLRLKRSYPGNLLIAAYCNDVMGYIPTQRMLQEAGYEASESMIFYGHPGPFADDVEERILGGIRAVLAGVGLNARAEVMRPALVTVVIPAFNRARTIEAALRSVQAQTFRDWQAIVVDDGSSDGTSDRVIELAKQDSRIQLRRHARNRGAQAARNTGIAAANTKWLAFLDSDDRWLPNSLELRLDAAQKYNAEVVHSDGYMIDDQGRQSLYGVAAVHGWIYRDVLNQRGPMFQGLLVSKNALEKINGLDERIVAMQEWDTAIRLAKNFEFAFVPVPTFVWDCRGEDRITRDRLRDIRGYEQVVRKNVLSMLKCSGPATVCRHYRNLANRYITLLQQKPR